MRVYSFKFLFFYTTHNNNCISPSIWYLCPHISQQVDFLLPSDWKCFSLVLWRPPVVRSGNFLGSPGTTMYSVNDTWPYLTFGDRAKQPGLGVSHVRESQNGGPPDRAWAHLTWAHLKPDQLSFFFITLSNQDALKGLGKLWAGLSG